ncbi:MAG: DUF1801 domain-containing protein [Tannerella sp.]|jgi:uncharacterized protein YdhG (YjbR/CyaY superfamily)|nr:DUF1801 domain-containing protein [Tannerella sp.]
MENQYHTVDEYIASYPAEVQERLQTVRSMIKAAAPAAEEKISWNMAAYKLNGKAFIYFAGCKNHIGIYPMPETVASFEPNLASYRHNKGSIQLPHNKPLPLDLLAQIIEYRMFTILS